MTLGHVTDHNTLRAAVIAQATRLVTAIDIGGPFSIGDPGHIDEHNKLADALALLAETAGITVDLPDAAQLDDTGHIADHALLEAALADVEAAPGFNAATGGTPDTFVIDGQTWKRHTFTSSGTFTVTTSAVPFKVTVIGAGGGGGAPADGFGASGGGAGGYHCADDTLAVGDIAVTVGVGGPGAGPVQIGGASGARGTQGGASSVATSWTAGGGYGGGGGPSVSNGAPGTGTPTPAADGGHTTIDHAAHGLDTTIGVGGNPAVGPYPGSSATAGQPGAVVIEYRIGA